MNLIPWRSKETERGELDRPTAFDPWRPMGTLWREMDRLFDRTLGEGAPGALGLTGWSPALDISETDKEVTVRAELPGVDAKDLDVSVCEGMLNIAGEKKESHEQKGRDFYRSERRYGSFRRSIPVPKTVNPDKIDAEYHDGVLTIRLEKDIKAQPKRIEVKPK
jgi:HSP20 family protein